MSQPVEVSKVIAPSTILMAKFEPASGYVSLVVLTIAPPRRSWMHRFHFEGGRKFVERLDSESPDKFAFTVGLGGAAVLTCAEHPYQLSLDGEMVPLASERSWNAPIDSANAVAELRKEITMLKRLVETLYIKNGPEQFGGFPSANLGLDSNVLRLLQSGPSFVVILQGWLARNSIGRLLFRSSRDGTTPVSFHSKCDNYSCTLTLIRTKLGSICGGFSPLSWAVPASGGGHVSAPGSWIFTLVNPAGTKPQKLMSEKAIIYRDASWGPYFGNNDLVLLRQPCHNFGNGCYSMIQPQYTCYPRSLELMANTGTEKQPDSLAEMEVFEVLEGP